MEDAGASVVANLPPLHRRRTQQRTQGPPWPSPITAAKATRCQCMADSMNTITVEDARVGIALSPILPPCLRRPSEWHQQHTDMMMTTGIFASRSMCVRQGNIIGGAPASPSTKAHPTYRHQRTHIKQAGYQPGVLNHHQRRTATSTNPCIVMVFGCKDYPNSWRRTSSFTSFGATTSQEALSSAWPRS